MGPKFRRSTFSACVDEPESSSENGGSGDDSRATALSPKKGKRSVKKKVVTVPMGGEAEGSGRSGGGCPPSDSWAWRKYGQKPIKGSPYPRAYYRCSSSKGCPARKQVERSRDDPTLLIITYACDHNHSVPTSKHHHSSAATVVPTTPPSPATLTAASTPPAAPQVTADDDVDAAGSEDQEDIFAYAAELGLVGDALMSFSWLPDVAMGPTSFVGPTWDDADVAVNLSMREEDESLFADLDELPECSAVFRRGRGNSTCKLSAPLCSGTT